MQNRPHTKARCCGGCRADLIVLIHAGQGHLVVLVRASSIHCPRGSGSQGVLGAWSAFVATKVNIHVHVRHVLLGPGHPAGTLHSRLPIRPSCHLRRLARASYRACAHPSTCPYAACPPSSWEARPGSPPPPPSADPAGARGRTLARRAQYRFSFWRADSVKLSMITRQGHMTPRTLRNPMVRGDLISLHCPPAQGQISGSAWGGAYRGISNMGKQWQTTTLPHTQPRPLPLTPGKAGQAGLAPPRLRSAGYDLSALDRRRPTQP